LCFGEIIPEFNFLVFLEWGHRQLAGIIGVIFLVLGGAILARPALRRLYWGQLLALAVVLASQIVLGGLTVLHLLAFWSVTLHLLFGNLFMALLIALAARLRMTGVRPPLPSGSQPAVAALAVLVGLQLALGGLVSSNYAGMACTEWPTCNGGVWFPTWTGIVGLQLAHRLGAYAVVAAALAFAWVSRADETLRRQSIVILGIVALQVAFGISNVLFGMPVELAVAHAATAHAIVATTTISLVGALSRAGFLAHAGGATGTGVATGTGGVGVASGNSVAGKGGGAADPAGASESSGSPAGISS
jgi:cytochrome c oxidase assembly protein subunit 15